MSQMKTNGSPNNQEAEGILLGAIMRDPDALDMVLPALTSEDVFYSPRHQSIYRIMLDLHTNLQPVDVTTVANALQQSGDLQSIGGLTYIGELEEGAIGKTNVTSYASIIKDKWLKRRLLDYGSKIVRDATADESTSDELLRKAESSLYLIGSRSYGNEPVQVSDMIVPFTENLLKGGENRNYVATRIEDFNQRFKLYYGDYIVIGGEPSMGKTMLGMDIVWYNLGFGKKSAVFSYDQTMNAIVLRYLTGRTGISRDRMSSGQLSAQEQDKLCQAAAKLASNGGVYIQDDSNLSVLDVWSQARKLKRTVGLDILLIDYVQLIPGHGRAENRNLELAEISRILTAMKKDLNVALIVLSQVNRTIKDRARIDPLNNGWRFPTYHMLRDSGSLTQDATVVIFPYIPHEACKREFGEQSQAFIDINRGYLDKYGIPLSEMGYVVVDKNKDGETGVVACRRDPVRMRFYSAAKFAETEQVTIIGSDKPF